MTELSVNVQRQNSAMFLKFGLENYDWQTGHLLFV